MSTATGPADMYSLRRQWLSRLAVAFMMLAGFIGGNSLALGGLPDWRELGPFWLAWAGFQAVCLMLGTAWARTWKGPDAFVAGLHWKLKKFRVRMRRCWFPGRDWDAYRSAEQIVIGACALISVVGFVLISLSLKVGLLMIFAAIFTLLVVVPYYRDAPENRTVNILFAGPLSFAWGYILAASPALLFDI